MTSSVKQPPYLKFSVSAILSKAKQEAASENEDDAVKTSEQNIEGKPYSKISPTQK